MEKQCLVDGRHSFVPAGEMYHKKGKDGPRCTGIITLDQRVGYRVYVCTSCGDAIEIVVMNQNDGEAA